MPSLSLTDLTYVTPDAQTLFSQLNYSQGPERVGLTGPNRSGKSTLLALITQKLTPTRGVINLSGAVLSQEQSWGLERSQCAPSNRVLEGKDETVLRHGDIYALERQLDHAQP